MTPAPFRLHDFRTVVGRRILLLFVICALVPTGWMAIETYRRVASQLANQAEAHVRSTTRSAGMALLDRLQLAASELDLVAQISAIAPAVRPTIPRLRVLTSVERLATDGVREVLYGTPSMSIPRASADGGNSLMLAIEDTPGGPRIRLGLPQSGGTLWATLDTDSLLATARLHVAAQPPYGPCLIVARLQIGCPSALPAALTDELTGAYVAQRHGSLTPIDGPIANGLPALTGSWKAFLRGYDTADPWLLVVSLDRRELLADADRFRWIYPRILILALALVVGLSTMQIRRNLRPLEALTAAADRFGRGSLDTRVDITSDDEFGAVGRAFNAMARQLRNQLKALGALHRFDSTVLANPARETIVDAVLDHGAQGVGADAAAVWLRTQGGGVVHAAMAGNASGKQREPMREPELPMTAHEVSDVTPAWLRALPPFSVEPFKRFLTLRVGSDADAGAIVLASYDADAFPVGTHDTVLQLRNQVSIALSAVKQVERLEQAHAGALAALSRSVDLASPWTAGHSERVAALSLAMGRHLGLARPDLDHLQSAALLHDIGKIGVPAAILDLPVGLRPEQVERLREHVPLGGRILEPIPAFSDILPVVLQHHEHWDGTGYPAGLSGSDIHPLARIVSVANAFDGLTSEQPDRPPLDAAAALDRIAARAGTAYEPAAVHALAGVLRRPLRAAHVDRPRTLVTT
jgi:putative nucleotidyltransferase with HDIG domain